MDELLALLLLAWHSGSASCAKDGRVADTGPLHRINQEGATGRGSAASLCRGCALDRLLAYHPGTAGLELLGHCQLVRLGQILSYRPPW